MFTEGDLRIFGWHSDTSDQWLLPTCTVPESQRHLRHRIRAVLGRWGFRVGGAREPPSAGTDAGAAAAGAGPGPGQR